MNTILIIIGVLVIVAGVVIYFVKAGKIADRDGDLIPDVVEDGIEDIKFYYIMAIIGIQTILSCSLPRGGI